MFTALNLLKFAIKEQMEYRANFIFGIIVMVINDFLFLSIFMLFFNYFQIDGFGMKNIFLIWAFAATIFGIVHGLFANIGRLSGIIESGKLDYYLSFPANLLKIITFTKVDHNNLGDILFGFIAICIYSFYFLGGSFAILQWFLLIVLCGFFVVGFFLILSSISFFMDKGSEIGDLIGGGYMTFSSWPYQIYSHNKIVYVMVGVLGVYPTIVLPYKIILGGGTLVEWVLMLATNLGAFALGLIVFKFGLKKYTSGNLVNVG